MTTIIIAAIITLFTLIALFFVAMGVLIHLGHEPKGETYTYMELINNWRASKKSIYVETHPLMARLDKESENSPVAVMLRNIR